MKGGFDANVIRQDFPALKRMVKEDVPLVYLDTTATSQKPKQVLDCLNDYYSNNNANVHRGIHTLAEEATAGYENARITIGKFINASNEKEIIYTRNTTEAINLVANSWGRTNLNSGDRIILTEMEHHSNLVPWQMLAASIGLEIDIIPVDDNGLLDLHVYEQLLDKNPKAVCVTHMSNVLGTLNPIKNMAINAHDHGALIIVDGAQSAPHMPVDVQDLDVDFFAFSAHKMCGPTGVGILWGRYELLDAMPPFLGGGDMIKRVHLRDFDTNDLPYKFEAGTPAIGEAIGMGAAVNYLNGLGMQSIWEHEQDIVSYAMDRLNEVPGLTVYGPEAEMRGGVTAFSLDGVHPHDISQILDGDGVAVRAGHHCAMPLHERYKLVATARASFYLYNTYSDVDKLIEGLHKVKQVFG
ncbi:MAG: cysteine desulfurase [Rhodospirillaceae bacterium]|nr:cysteine desulfurase [Rhodospirillaceae bacterium]|tara:strand:+ start:1482 stop:2714 length:1233 start_codon:yes stop_codon:yes gene_type:complete